MISFSGHHYPKQREQEVAHKENEREAEKLEYDSRPENNPELSREKGSKPLWIVCLRRERSSVKVPSVIGIEGENKMPLMGLTIQGQNSAEILRDPYHNNDPTRLYYDV